MNLRNTFLHNQIANDQLVLRLNQAVIETTILIKINK